MRLAKIIGLIILILIPLSIATFIGFYSYDRYQGTWLPNYLDQAPTTIEKIERLVRYDSVAYTIDPVYEYTDPNHMFKLAVYGRLTQSPAGSNYVNYIMYMYAVDFSQLSESNKPIVSLAYGVDITSTMTFGYETRFIDREATPAEDDVEDEIFLTYKIVFSASVDMEGVVSFTIFRGSELTENYELFLEDEITGIIHHPVTFESSVLTVAGFNTNIKSAGYFGYVFGKYIWWQALVTLILSGALSYLFYLVWQVDTVPTPPTTRKK